MKFINLSPGDKVDCYEGKKSVLSADGEFVIKKRGNLCFIQYFAISLLQQLINLVKQSLLLFFIGGF